MILKRMFLVVWLICFVLTFIFKGIGCVFGQDGQEQPRIAVLPFTDTNTSAKSEGYGEAIAGMLMTELINGKVFQVVERSEIDRMMQEIAFQISGAVDSRTAKQIGELLGVDIIVFGNVAKFDPLVETDIRLVDTQSGEALLAEHASSESGVEIRNMVENLARKIEKRYMGRLMGEVTITSYPSEAFVFIDGVMEGKTPLTKNLSLGLHKIRIGKKNFSIWEQTVFVGKNENKINASLTVSPEYLNQQAERKHLDEAEKRRLAEERTQEQKSKRLKKNGGKKVIYILGGATLVGGVAAVILAGGNSADKQGSIKITW